MNKMIILVAFIRGRNDEIGLKKYVQYLFIFNWDYLIEFVSNLSKFIKAYRHSLNKKKWIPNHKNYKIKNKALGFCRAENEIDNRFFK